MKKFNWAKTKIQSKQKQNEYELEKNAQASDDHHSKENQKNAQKWVYEKMHANSGKKD